MPERAGLKMGKNNWVGGKFFERRGGVEEWGGEMDGKRRKEDEKGKKENKKFNGGLK